MVALTIISAVLLVNSAASATTVMEVFTGTVSGNDYSGLFGAPGTSLNGAQFSATYIFNTSLGTVTPDHTEVYGGSITGALFYPPAVRAPTLRHQPRRDGFA